MRNLSLNRHFPLLRLREGAIDREHRPGKELPRWVVACDWLVDYYLMIWVYNPLKIGRYLRYLWTKWDLRDGEHRPAGTDPPDLSLLIGRWNPYPNKRKQFKRLVKFVREHSGTTIEVNEAASRFIYAQGEMIYWRLNSAPPIRIFLSEGIAASRIVIDRQGDNPQPCYRIRESKP